MHDDPPRGTRRLAAALALTIALTLLATSMRPAHADAAAAASPAQPAIDLAPGVRVVRDGFEPGRQPDGNSVLFDGPRGTLVVDTGRHLAHAQAVLAAVQARGGPLVAIVNTHWHLDHLGGNAWLRMQVPGVVVHGSEAVGPALQGWLADSRRQMQAMLDAPADRRPDAATEAMIRIDLALIDQGPRLLPDVVVDGERTVSSIGRPLVIGHEGPAATAADLWVWDAASRVLAAGDLVTLPAPFLDTACAPGWRAALAHVDALPFERLVPGHGAPMTRADFGRWRHAFESLLDCAAAPGEEAACTAGWVRDLGPLLAEGERERASRMTRYYVSEVLRAPAARRDRFCAGDAREAASAPHAH